MEQYEEMKKLMELEFVTKIELAAKNYHENSNFEEFSMAMKKATDDLKHQTINLLLMVTEAVERGFKEKDF